MSDSDHNVQRTRQRLRFSLTSLFLLITIVGLAVALWTTSQGWKKDATALQKLRNQVGELTISDPDRVHVIRVPTTGPLNWQWRVFLPAGREFQLRLITGEVPKTGVPGPGQALGMYSRFRCSGEFLLSASVQENHRGTYVLAASAPNWEGSNPFQNDEWQLRSKTISQIELGKTESVAPGEPMVLVRLRADHDGTSPESPCDGLMIAIEETND
jgi:hypothetical protein